MYRYSFYRSRSRHSSSPILQSGRRWIKNESFLLKFRCIDPIKISSTQTLLPGSNSQFSSVSSLNQIQDCDKVLKRADKITSICRKAEEISKKASDSMISFSTTKTTNTANYTLFNENDANIFYKESKLATDLANELLEIASSLPIPLCNISPQQHSILHGSILSVTKLLLHLLRMDHMGQMNAHFCEQTFSIESQSNSINLLSSYQDQKQKNAQSAVDLAQLSAHFDLPFHLPLYTELFNACNSNLPSGMSGPAILQLCSALQISFPLFRDWENLLVPLFLSKLQLHKISGGTKNMNKVTVAAYQNKTNRTCKEILTLLQVTQREYKWKLHWENALLILKALKEHQECNYQFFKNDGEIDLHSFSGNAEEHEHVYELKQILTDSLEVMLKNNKSILKQLAQDVQNILLSSPRLDDNLASFISKEDLYIILNELFSQGNEDDEFDCDFDEEKQIQDAENIINVKDLLDLDSLYSDTDIVSSEDEDTENDEDLRNNFTEPSDEIIPSPLSKKTSTSMKNAFTARSHVSDEILKSLTTKSKETRLGKKEGMQSSHHDFIYYRDDSNQEWSLPDVSSQLIKYNCNLPLKFSKEYEDELAMQIAQEEDLYDEFVYSNNHEDE